jgi:conjugal transfer pilus assembly protein TraU
MTKLMTRFIARLITILIKRLILCLVINFILSLNLKLQANCKGRFLNPITDVCWSCIFPITIGGVRVSTNNEDSDNQKSLVCSCSKPIARIGIPVSFWEPARLVDVTRTPYCMVNMAGTQLMEKGVQGRGSVGSSNGSRMRHSFYQVHWYIYPIIYWLELLVDFVCLEKASFDVGYLTELDPFWNDDETAFILNPEAIVFANPIAQSACSADCISTSMGFSQDSLFWCAGCQGCNYPFTGTISYHVGGVQASLLMVQRMLAKLHRQGLAWGYIGKQGLCGKYPMPVIKKSQYKTQMIYPVPSSQNKSCYPLGRLESLWASGKEFAGGGEDFGYLIWRKRNCCLL